MTTVASSRRRQGGTPRFFFFSMKNAITFFESGSSVGHTDSLSAELWGIREGVGRDELGIVGYLPPPPYTNFRFRWPTP